MIRRAETGQRQTELADAALLIIATRGITALTTRALAEQVGLTSGAIFKHFASLDALLEAVVERVEAVLDSTFPEDATLSPLERLEHFIGARTTAVGERSDCRAVSRRAAPSSSPRCVTRKPLVRSVQTSRPRRWGPS
jgi:AcrR family transcriptional regulator